MPKYRPGLHKDVSTIFDGVPIPKSNGAPQPNKPSWDRPAHASPTPGAPSHLAPAAPRVQPSPQSPPKTDEAEQQKVYTETRLGPAPRQQRAWRQMKKRLFTPKAGVSAKRQKTMVLLVPILFVVLILVVIRVFGIPSFKMAEAVSTTEELITESAADSDYKIDWQIPAAFPTTLRDPMKFNPPEVSVAEVEAVELNVKGIVYAVDKPSAIIGTEIVHEGDTVSGATVLRIGPGSIEFEMNGKTWVQKVQ